MKLHFEPDLDFQLEAIEAVCGLFRGNETGTSVFTVSVADATVGSQLFQGIPGIGNRLRLTPDELLANLRKVQFHNRLPPSDRLENLDDLNFTVEMETGTGKTYVYLRTIFELNKRFGFTKFVIVVPSIAIKEGVYKTIEITREHFHRLYAGVVCNCFLYDSTRSGQIRNFAAGTAIEVMIATVGAINKKDVNNIYKPGEGTGDDTPIDLIRRTRPIVIVDEPQSVDGGLEGRGKAALAAMHPLCTLRYSATHIDPHHMIYRLDAVDAYNRKLVKQIEVASITSGNDHNRPYIKVVSVGGGKNAVEARLNLDVELAGGGISRRTVRVRAGDNLEQLTGRQVYANCLVTNISRRQGSEFVEFSHLEQPLHLDEASGEVDEAAVKRLMIRQAIQEHLDKEMRLADRGIKVLTLFFVDKVENYRVYRPDGGREKGPFAKIFEEEYVRAVKSPKYHNLFSSLSSLDRRSLPGEVHDGYFSIDKKGVETDTAENNQANRDNAERGYQLIMRDKERLLGFESKLKFIFSHSALREGWDNPNVFQICVLREVQSGMSRRQMIGRGLRLCVNQRGDRVRDENVNLLTVIANESYTAFADTLQKEIETEAGIRFGTVDKQAFAAVVRTDAAGDEKPLGIDASLVIWESLRGQGLIAANGKVQDDLRLALRNQTLRLPEQFADVANQVEEILRKLAGRLDIRDAAERKRIPARRAVLDSPEFRELWERIKHKTTYRVKFDNDELIRLCAKDIEKAVPVSGPTLDIHIAKIRIGRDGVSAAVTAEEFGVEAPGGNPALPDILSDLEEKTRLTRRSLTAILIDSHRLEDFRINPQRFIALAAETIERTKRRVLVDGIKYQRIGDDCYYAQELFEREELTGYLKNCLESQKSVYEMVVFDSEGVEKNFALELERNKAVKVYAKLPHWFTIPTPLGNYNPDWAVLIEQEGEERLFFVVETKGSLFPDDISGLEDAKIQCGGEHFKDLAARTNPARFVRARKLKDVLDHCG